MKFINQETILRNSSSSFKIRDSLNVNPRTKILILILSLLFTTACNNNNNTGKPSESVTELCFSTKKEIRELVSLNVPLQINSKLEKISLRNSDPNADLSNRFSNLCTSIYSWDNFFKPNEKIYICRINVDNIENHGQFELMFNPENREKLKNFLGSEIPVG